MKSLSSRSKGTARSMNDLKWSYEVCYVFLVSNIHLQARIILLNFSMHAGKFEKSPAGWGKKVQLYFFYLLTNYEIIMFCFIIRLLQAV